MPVSAISSSGSHDHDTNANPDLIHQAI